MRLALIGYGKMGRILERLALQRGHTIVTQLAGDRNRGAAGLTAEALARVEVALEFTRPDAVVTNLLRLAELRVATVCGTTGWFEHLPRVREAFVRSGASLIYGANMSIGMNVMFELTRRAAECFARFGEYAPWLIEHHHAEKRDAPSGTGLALRELLAEQYGPRTPDCLSVRAGHAPGMHELSFDGPADRVSLRHEARSREGFAHGALFAAERVRGAGVRSFEELLWHETPGY